MLMFSGQAYWRQADQPDGMLRSVFPDDNSVNMNCECKLMDMQATIRYT